jgi:STE24 endopeptidase
MPLTVLIAIFVAFWYEAPAHPRPLPPAEVISRILEALGGVALVGVMAAVLGRWVVRRVSRDGLASPSTRQGLARGQRGINLLSLAVFFWIIHRRDWPLVVGSGLGLRDTILVDDVLILLPFVLAQVAGWWGLYWAERVLKAGRSEAFSGPGRYLLLKARQSMGMVLPVAVVFSLGQDLVSRYWPQEAHDPWVQLGLIAAMGALVLVCAPAFVRLTWPTRPLPPGPLRGRLECLAQRFGFRYTDILIWDTGQTLVNAGVTGAVPWFRYVLLTDALIESLDPRQIEAVFGHEVGHIAHRHLSYFGFFFLGSIGVTALVGFGIDRYLTAGSWLWGINPGTVDFIKEGSALAGVGLYFLLVFGFLSRRFERQADIFGCRAVSCGRPACPPHADLNGHPGAVAETQDLCPVGIGIFTHALADVAALNGMEPGALSWRHGSIRRRITFLKGLEGRPEVERRFQNGVKWLRLALALLLVLAVAQAIRTGALEQFR